MRYTTFFTRSENLRLQFIYRLLTLVAIFSFSAYSDQKPKEHNAQDTILPIVENSEKEILRLRRRELDTEARVERLRIDIFAIEKRWQETRESEIGNRLLNDSLTPEQLKTKVLWEQLTTYRADLENAQVLLECYKKQRTTLRIIRSTRSSPANVIDIWQTVIDTTDAFRRYISTERQWRTSRLAESEFERTVLAEALDSIDYSRTDRLLQRKRLRYFTQRISSDSLVIVSIATLDSVLATYDLVAHNALTRMTPQQKKRQLIRRLKSIWNFTLYTVDDKPLTIGKIILSLLIIIAGLKLAQKISRMIAAAIKTGSKLDEGVVDAGRKLFFYTFAALFTLYALYLVQVPLTAFTVMGGALALGLGFGSQNILKNFISGIILLLERPMKTGDFIEIDGVIGTVESIGLRSTRIRTPENVHMVLPNSSFLEKNVINWTLADKLVRLKLVVGIQYGSPVHQAKQLLLDAAASVPTVLKKPEPEVLFADFGDSALTFHLYVWIRLSKIIDRKRVVSAVRFAINDIFNEEGIVIAFPQRDVHLDMNKPLQVQIAAERDHGKKVS